MNQGLLGMQQKSPELVWPGLFLLRLFADYFFLGESCIIVSSIVPISAVVSPP
jgi:hypothetical protein